MSSNAAALNETVWLDANRFYDAERRFYEVSLNESKRRQNPGHTNPNPGQNDGMSQLVSSLASEIAYAREKIHNFLKSPSTEIDTNACLLSRLEKVERDQKNMKQDVDKLISQMEGVLSELSIVRDFMVNAKIEKKDSIQVNKTDAKNNFQNGSSVAPDDDEIDLFGSDEENEDEVKLREQRLKTYADKKAKKPALVAKSSVVLDVKPWDDETDLKAMETAVREIATDGLVWGASKLVPLAYSIKKLQIVAIVEDEKVSVDWLQETIQDIEELVQSVDIAAFNKL